VRLGFRGARGAAAFKGRPRGAWACGPEAETARVRRTELGLELGSGSGAGKEEGLTCGSPCQRQREEGERYARAEAGPAGELRPREERDAGEEGRREAAAGPARRKTGRAARERRERKEGLRAGLQREKRRGRREGWPAGLGWAQGEKRRGKREDQTKTKGLLNFELKFELKFNPNKPQPIKQCKEHECT
jgi:hypothetical protein